MTRRNETAHETAIYGMGERGGGPLVKIYLSTPISNLSRYGSARLPLSCKREFNIRSISSSTQTTQITQILSLHTPQKKV